VAGEPPDTVVDEREQEASLARIERGGIPLAAERRLERLRDGGAGAFTSDLSVAEFALGHRLGLRPLSQVMGSCFYQVGWQYSYGASYSWDGSALEELKVLTQAWNQARGLALSRMAQEASHIGADAVVGVHLRRGEHDWASGAVEYVVVGTAVKESTRARQAPVLTDLSLQDYWKLHQAGVEPRGFVGATSCFFIHRGAMARSRQMLSFASNEEIPEYTQGVYSARETALARLTQDARAAGAEGLVGMSVEHTMEMQEIKTGGEHVRGLVVTFHVTGTAIGQQAGVTVTSPELQLELNAKGVEQ
jgi:uncharacterized protein YbjQ (UPF0145 family)